MRIARTAHDEETRAGRVVHDEAVRPPRVSVLMPVRDSAPWIAEALASILGQSEPALELIAVDDGSTDCSRAILQRWASRDRRVRVLTTSADTRGIVAALNMALAAARAPLVARMDADDIADPQRVAVQIKALTANPALFAVTCKVKAFPARNAGEGMRRYLEWQNALFAPAELSRERFVESPLLHPSVMMRTAALRSLGGWRDVGWPEDWDLFLRAFESNLEIARVPRFLLAWRLHRSQATRTDERYSEARFRLARAHYLARALPSGRDVWIIGAGPVGKALGKALAREGAAVAGFAEIDRRKIGGRVRDHARSWPVVSMSALMTIEPRPVGIAAVGRRGARDRIRQHLDVHGWRECVDYFAAA